MQMQENPKTQIGNVSVRENNTAPRDHKTVLNYCFRATAAILSLFMVAKLTVFLWGFSFYAVTTYLLIGGFIGLLIRFIQNSVANMGER